VLPCTRKPKPTTALFFYFPLFFFSFSFFFFWGGGGGGGGGGGFFFVFSPPIEYQQNGCLSIPGPPSSSFLFSTVEYPARQIDLLSLRGLLSPLLFSHPPFFLRQIGPTTSLFSSRRRTVRALSFPPRDLPLSLSPRKRTTPPFSIP